MHITGIGINASDSRLGGSLPQLEDDLTFFQACGFDAVELSMPGLDVVIGGSLRRDRAERIVAITKRFDIAYSVHAPNRLNLALPQPGNDGQLQHDLERDTLAACLEFCPLVGAHVLVYHSGLIALREPAFGLSPLPDDDALEHARVQEVRALRELAPLAAEHDVLIAMENRCPNPREVAALIQHGADPQSLSKYHGGLLLPNLVRQVKEVDHPNVGITLDFGHLFLAAHHCGYDYLEAIREAAPYIRHLHVGDNFGRTGGVFEGLNDRIPFGEGDLHMPLGWGIIPHAESLAQLPNYEGLYLLEIRIRFRSEFPAMLKLAGDIVREVESSLH